MMSPLEPSRSSNEPSVDCSRRHVVVSAWDFSQLFGRCRVQSHDNSVTPSDSRAPAADRPRDSLDGDTSSRGQASSILRRHRAFDHSCEWGRFRFYVARERRDPELNNMAALS